MTSNEKIVAAAWRRLRPPSPRGNEPGTWLPPEPGKCLAAVRVVLEDALQMREGELYDRWVKKVIETNFPVTQRDPIARDAERSFAQLGFDVPFSHRRPGDLLFDWTAAPREDFGTTLGHVGILLEVNGEDWVLENTEHPSRGLRKLDRAGAKTAIALTPLEHFIIPNDHNKGLPTRVIRIPG